MPIQYILGNLLASNEGSAGVLFLDESGETVEVACADFTPYQVRLVGAYLGIYLRHLARVCGETGLGMPRRIHIEKKKIHIYAEALPDGYYVALLQQRPGLVAQAQRTLGRAAQELRREFFS